MKKNLIYLSSLLGMTSLVISGCAPELARTNYGPEEQQWKNYVQGCYNTWTPPPAPAPYSENNTSTSAVSTIDSVPLATTTAETTIPVVTVDSEITQPIASAPFVDTATTATALESTLSTYTVKKGDSLWIISKKVYRDGKYWKKILDANKGKLSSPSSVREGMMLNIPAK
jgi:nucleoid-associated protein YgaU